MVASPTLTENSKRMRRPLLGIGLVGLGLLLLAVGGGYYLYTWIADSNLDSLVYKPTGLADDRSALTLNDPTTLQQLRGAATGSSDIALSSTFPDPAAQRLFPGESIPFQDWAYPWAAEPPLPAYDPLIDGFLPIEPGAFGSLSPATRVRIPAIDLDADISELAILDLGDYRAYETPKNVVGHIPESANPGEAGNIWLFGHLESLIRGEGSIFRNLPKIPGLLREGERVYVIMETPRGEYLYEAGITDVLHASELSLYQEDQPTLTLVTCVPQLKYNKRLLVTAEFVGFRPTV
ncbi:MAG: sortase [Chloroflexi bacterium]|nr:sortase [Chloroflexota bacterium]